ncbi:carboxy-cis,cis-muconate cyclase [Rhodotorula toruloides]|uniref:Carboxy-cis,cis-muconate cyclase n=1 Tax=Rhodotorula toruloides TaxID=5286 RepID=A0A511KEN5_RHOTO|nr:carboxy-cis,cis-muconate cyclase [Rhodotorula toruloides]
MVPYLMYAGGYEGRILTLAFNPSASNAGERLKVVGRVQCGAAPTWLTFSQNGKHLYAADEWAEGDGALTALSVSEEGILKPLSTVKTGGLWPCHSCVFPLNPPQLVTTNYKGASVHCITLSSSGALESSASSLLSVLDTGSSLGPIGWRQEQAHPHGAHPDPLGRVIVVPDLGTDDLRILAPSSADPRQWVERERVHLTPGDGPRHVLFGPLRSSNRPGVSKVARLYVLNELNNSISVLSVSYPSSSDEPTSPVPTITILQSRISLLPSKPMQHQTDFSSWHAAELVLSPTGQTLIASNRAESHDPLNGTAEGPEDLLAVFELDQEGLVVEESRRLIGSGGRAPRHMSLSSESLRLKARVDKAIADGRWLAVALHDSDEVVVFERVGGVDGRELSEVARLKGAGRPGIVLWA